MGIISVKTKEMDVPDFKDGVNFELDKLLNSDLPKLDIKIKNLQYRMDFGSTEVVIKMGLN